jgi:hypothetical protein
MSTSGMYATLASAISDGSTTFFDFQNIPVSSYAGLVITAKVRQQAATFFPYWAFTINADNTANRYNVASVFQSGADYGAQALGGYNTGDNQIYVTRNPEGSTSGDPRWAPNSFQYFHMFLPNASSSTQFKTGRWSAVASNNISTPYAVVNLGFVYASTNPITRIAVGTGGGNWTAGTEFIIYGYGPL